MSKKLKEGWGGIDPGQGRLFEKMPDKDYKGIAAKEKARKARDLARKKKEEEGE